MIKHALGGQPTCDGSCPLQPDSAAPGTAGAAASAPPKLMEVGSKGGYYSGKSPKLLLHELCLKEKVKPRYKAVEAGPGLWRCKVWVAGCGAWRTCMSCSRCTGSAARQRHWIEKREAGKILKWM